MADPKPGKAGKGVTRGATRKHWSPAGLSPSRQDRGRVYLNTAHGGVKEELPPKGVREGCPHGRRRVGHLLDHLAEGHLLQAQEHEHVSRSTCANQRAASSEQRAHDKAGRQASASLAPCGFTLDVLPPLARIRMHSHAHSRAIHMHTAPPPRLLASPEAPPQPGAASAN
jgi:hypothetical protein